MDSLFDVSDDNTFVPFTDMLFNVVMGFSFMVFIAFALIRPEALTGNVDVKADYIINASWPDFDCSDVDLYVMDPSHNIVWYNNHEAGLIGLDRDDRGCYRDTVIINGERTQNPLNQETVTLRGIVPGEYVVNVQMFEPASTNPTPIPVTVEVEKLNPTLEIVYDGTVNLTRKGDEDTVIRFTLDADGNPSDLNNRPVSLHDIVRGGTGN